MVLAVVQIALLRAHPYSHARHCNIAFSVDGTYLFTGMSGLPLLKCKTCSQCGLDAQAARTDVYMVMI